MKKVLLAGVAGCALFIAHAASADVNVLANIDKTKVITVTQTVTITKTVDLNAVVAVIPDKAAESTSIINQSNYNNFGCGNCAEKRDEITNSIGGTTAEGNNGIVNVNQAAGNMANQGNAVSVAWDFESVPTPDVPPIPPTLTETPGGGFAHAQAHVDQKNGAYNGESTGSVILSPNTVDTVNLLFRDAVISNSINDNTGIVQVNQATGNMNNQANNISLAVSLLPSPTENGGVALSEADLGQLTTGNSAYESDSNPTTSNPKLLGVHKSASITGSVNDNTGIVGVNQGAGNMSNQANNVSAAVVVVPSAFGL